MAKRSFSSGDKPVKSDDYHGQSNYASTSPDMIAKGVDSINISITFEEAIKFALAVQSAVLNLNRYDRRSAKGRDMGLVLSIKTGTQSIAVIENTVSRPSKD